MGSPVSASNSNPSNPLYGYYKVKVEVLLIAALTAALHPTHGFLAAFLPTLYPVEIILGGSAGGGWVEGKGREGGEMKKD